jgi:tripartite-type tricarboxylate transporter receptor subunit TctC
MLIARSASCLCIHPSLPVKGVKDFVALARTRPGTINYGSPGVGTVGHLATELFATQAGIKMNHVPYKGASQYTIDLLAGHIEFAIIPIRRLRAAAEPRQAARDRRDVAQALAAVAQSSDCR